MLLHFFIASWLFLAAYVVDYECRQLHSEGADHRC